MTDEQIIQRAREAGMTGEATPAVIEFVRNLINFERDHCLTRANIALLGASRELNDRVLKAIRTRGQA